MANEYLKQKWGMWFDVVDGKRQHNIYYQEIMHQQDIFGDLSHLDAERLKQTKEAVDKLIKEDLFYGKPGPISREQFIELQDEDFKADRNNYIEKRRKYFDVLFHIFSVSRDDSLTEEEFVNALRAPGHENIALTKQFFQSYDPVNGLVPLRTLIDSWVQFTTCENSSKPDIVKAGLDTGV